MPMKHPPHPGRIVRHECIEPLGLTVTHELKGVGRNLQDHPAMTVKQLCTQPITLLSHTHPAAPRILPG